MDEDCDGCEECMNDNRPDARVNVFGLDADGMQKLGMASWS